ncbi:rubredoxin [Imbroritus primus]|jgi:rubredoxin|uniref:rubredoxin n=1 Tax=Imbroritus primus TaxID=3058603 RepID=UPI003D161050
MSQPADPRVWDCLLCGYSYDPAAGAPDHGIAAGTPWEAVPADWACPECGAGKGDFDPDIR